LLKKKYGDAESVQSKIKDSYDHALYTGSGKGTPQDTHKMQVMNGMINLYNEKVGRAVLPPADYVWKV